MKTLALVLIFLTIFQLCLSQEERPLSLALSNGGCGQCQIEACRTPSSFECLAGKKYAYLHIFALALTDTKNGLQLI